MTGLLLLAVVLSATPATQPASPPQANISTDTQAATDPVEGSSSYDQLQVRPNADICYKIRAYIFKRDDDHAPRMVGSTTCPSQRPRTRSTDGFVPHLEPATAK